METVSTPMQDDSSGANPSSASVKSDDSSPRHESGRGSPPPNCAICLGTCRNKSFTDSCLHQFCFKCLLTWSRVKAECPLCKQNFRSIIHNVRSNHQYEEYMVEQRQTEEALERLDFESLTASTRRFRYRTTLTLPRRETIAIQQLLLQHYPIMADVFPPPAPRTLPARRRRSPAAFRRTVYRHNLWARPLPDFTGRFRDCSPEFYRYNDSQMHRLVPWLNRELHYLLNENIGHISYVIARILELLPQYHVNSTEFREAMQVYFRDRTEHFLHELYCFASTPYDMTGYDRNVQYTTDTRISTMVNEVISSSESEASVDSDIVMVSSSGPADPPPGPSRPPAPVYPQNYIPQPAANNVIPIETISQSDTDDDDEVMVVGYIKPPQDRTPEVVDLLGSDSDVIVQDAPAEPQPQTSEAQEARQAPLVKLILKRHAMDAPPDSDSDDSSYTPPPRRRRRPRSGSATTSDTCRSTPEPAAPPAPASEPEPASSPRDSSSSSSSSSYASCVSSASSSPSLFIDTDTPSSSSEEDRKRRAPRSKRLKRKRDVDPSSAERRSKSRKSRPRRDRQAARPEKDKAGKRKPNSGKGAKAARRTEPAPAPTEEPAAPEPGPSGSGAGGRKRRASESRKRRRPSRESKRLRSVVNVMYNTTKKNGEASSSPSGGAPGSPAAPGASRVARDSDSDDDLPLNLTVQKTYLSL
ncbi:E3 ubiquitin-protein ligase Topors [Ostrinia furnacalis]|uniref:E3 ubiquitin-protein ligase Topors n=1 Tax=Ostrinia furnacalis TaxID=93504 RepID=UPI00103E3197|nr:E3 ubiquitin-protein ligase Topors [Ostrinia furnacalis]